MKAFERLGLFLMLTCIFVIVLSIGVELEMIDNNTETILIGIFSGAGLLYFFLGEK